jgi:hypothetical protein
MMKTIDSMQEKNTTKQIKKLSTHYLNYIYVNYFRLLFYFGSTNGRLAIYQ